MPVAVNRLSAAELRQQLALVPRLSVVAAEAILRLRPFADKADLRNRVNGAVACWSTTRLCRAKARRAIQVHACGSSNQQPQRTHNAEYARKLLALHITVPWSAWNGGYEQNSGFQIGMVWDYSSDVIHDPLPAARRMR